MRLGERIELNDKQRSQVCGCETGRVVATFSHEAEAESFIELVNGIGDYMPGQGEHVLAYHKDWGFSVSSIDKTGKIPIGLSEDKSSVWFKLPDRDFV
jgi:hypothetical protein